MDSKDKNLDNSLESAVNMTQDEIERLLAQQEQFSEPVEVEDADLASLLADLEGESNSKEDGISDLLNKADHNQAIDESILSLMNRQNENGDTAYEAMDLFSGEAIEKEGFTTRIKKRIQEKKQKKEEKKDQKKQQKAEKKLQKEEKRQQKNSKKKSVHREVQVPSEHKETASGNAGMDEAFALLQGTDTELSNENTIDENGTKVSDKEKKNKKKQKSEEDSIKEKKDNKKKEKKTKKGKENKKGKKSEKSDEPIREKVSIEEAIEELEDDLTEFPHKRKIIMVFAASILIMIGFLVVNYYFTGYANRKLAEEAYEEGDYLECYQLLYGQKMNESQAIMYHRSEIVLRTDVFWSGYNEFVKEKKWLEGLDRLVQFVYNYPKTSTYATEWNCLDTVENAYVEVQNILIEEYDTDIEEVSAIAEFEDDVEYTRSLVEIVERKKKRDALNEKYPDMLPEEEERISQEEKMR